MVNGSETWGYGVPIEEWTNEYAICCLSNPYEGKVEWKQA